LQSLKNSEAKHEGTRPTGGRGHKWQDNIKIDLKDVGCKVVNWIQVTQDRV